jgi:hypothetical protein
MSGCPLGAQYGLDDTRPVQSALGERLSTSEEASHLGIRSTRCLRFSLCPMNKATTITKRLPILKMRRQTNCTSTSRQRWLVGYRCGRRLEGRLSRAETRVVAACRQASLHTLVVCGTGSATAAVAAAVASFHWSSHVQPVAGRGWLLSWDCAPSAWCSRG